MSCHVKALVLVLVLALVLVLGAALLPSPRTLLTENARAMPQTIIFRLVGSRLRLQCVSGTMQRPWHQPPNRNCETAAVSGPWSATHMR
jgi:hypothetical protein